jgi:addiction module RelE/StbE family toxin
MPGLNWTRRALRDLVEIESYIAERNPAAAEGVAARIVLAARRLSQTPLIGRAGHFADTREWVVRRTPYLIVYRLVDGAVHIMTVRHGARRWPPLSQD